MVSHEASEGRMVGEGKLALCCKKKILIQRWRLGAPCRETPSANIASGASRRCIIDMTRGFDIPADCVTPSYSRSFCCLLPQGTPRFPISFSFYHSLISPRVIPILLFSLQIRILPTEFRVSHCAKKSGIFEKMSVT